jgi:hypothetical protein
VTEGRTHIPQSDTMTVPVRMNLLLMADGTVGVEAEVQIADGRWVTDWHEGDTPLAAVKNE